uniref:Secreted protein n=1 Tax=Macrostomum lignano TaxID=282301 RepID=A0A1I8FDZ1_9PLAT
MLSFSLPCSLALSTTLLTKQINIFPILVGTLASINREQANEDSTERPGWHVPCACQPKLTR